MARESKRKRDEKRFGKPGRVLDSMISNGLVPPPWMDQASPSLIEDWRHIGGMAHKILRNGIKSIQIDNITEYACNHMDSIKKWDGFPGVANPFRNTWVESISTPSFSKMLGDTGILGFGALIMDMGVDDVVENIRRNAKELGDSEAPGAKSYAENLLALLEENVGRAKKALVIMIFLKCKSIHGDPEVYGPTLISQLVMDGNGIQIIPPLKRTLGNRPEHLTPRGREIISRLEEDTTFLGLMNICLLSLCFLNCKNVTMEVDGSGREFDQERKKAGLKPFVRYHKINIEPMKVALASQGGIETNGLKKALHIVRGHFATYTEDKPLFGHFSGTVWKPSHARGSLDNGVVVSDYNVKPPKP